MTGYRKLQRRLGVFVFVFLIILSLLVVFSAQLAKWGAIRYFDNLGANASIAEIQLSLLDSQLQLNKVQLGSDKARRLSFDTFTLDWQWSGLLSNQVTVDKLSLVGLALDIQATQGKLTSIGPIELAWFAADSQQQEASKPWLLRVGEVALNRFELCYGDTAAMQNHCANWQSLELDSEFVASSRGGPKFNGNIALTEFEWVDKARLDSLRVSALNLDGAQLSWQTIDLAALNTTINAASLDKINIGHSQLDINTLTGSIGQSEIHRFGAIAGGHRINVDKLAIASAALSDGENAVLSDFGLKGLSAYEGDSQVAEVQALDIDRLQLAVKEPQGEVKGLSIKDVWLNQRAIHGDYAELLRLESMRVAALRGSGSEQSAQGIELSNVGVMADLDKPGEKLLSLDALQVDTLKHAQQLDIGLLQIIGLQAKLVQDDAQGLNLANWLAPRAEENAESKSSPTEKPMMLNIARLSVEKSHQLSLTESTSGKAVTHVINGLQLSVTPLVIAEQGVPGLIEMSAMIQDNGALNTKGQLSLGKPLALDLDGRLAHLSLTPYSPYSARFIGYRIDQGQLNVDFKLGIAGDVIDSRFDLLLSKFELGALQQFEQSSLNQKLGVPLPTALDLIRDSDDSIALSLPVKGNLSQPDFSLSGVLETVSLKAIKTAVLYTYSPLGVLSIAGDLVSLATALRFEPIEFVVGSQSLDDKAMARLDKAATVLQQKLKVSLVLCANATQAELPQGQTLDEAAIGLLRRHAETRQQAVKTYLVEHHGIAQERLLTCNVKLDDDIAAKPVVGLRI